MLRLLVISAHSVSGLMYTAIRRIVMSARDSLTYELRSRARANGRNIGQVTSVFVDLYGRYHDYS